MDVLEIQLPEEVQNLTEGSLFDNDGLISDDMLSKYLAYNPELIEHEPISKRSLRTFTRHPMWDEGHIKHYSRFHRAILDLEVGYSRIAHPFAALHQVNWHPPCGFNLSS